MPPRKRSFVIVERLGCAVTSLRDATYSSREKIAREMKCSAQTIRRWEEKHDDAQRVQRKQYEKFKAVYEKLLGVELRLIVRDGSIASMLRTK